MGREKLKYPIHELGLSKEDWARYDEVKAVRDGNALADVMKLRDKLTADQFARIGGGEWYQFTDRTFCIVIS